MHTHWKFNSNFTSIAVIVIIQLLIHGSLWTFANGNSVDGASSTDEYKEEEDEYYHRYGLVVEIFPLDIVKMYEGGVKDVSLIIETNKTQMWNLPDAENISSLPVWFRCPGVITITSDNPSLLEVVNDTLHVTGADFFNLNHTITLISHHRGPAYQYLQVHWTSTKPIEECGFDPVDEESPHQHSNLHINGDKVQEDIQQRGDTNGDHSQLKRPLLQTNTNDYTDSIDRVDGNAEDGQDKAMTGEDEITNDENGHNSEENKTEDEQNIDNENNEDDNHDEETMRNNYHTEQSRKSILFQNNPEEKEGMVESNYQTTRKYNIYKEGLIYQGFRRRREIKDPTEVHHHHHFDQTDITVPVTVTPKPKKVVDILLLDDYRVAVLRTPSTLDTIFVVVVSMVVAFNTFLMGMQVDYKIVLEVFKKPIGPIVGFISQFLFMPLASYGLAHLFFDDINLQLGLFTLGCSPGGNGSNFWTLLLKGDLNLSITMTFVSTTCAIFMMPFWLYTLGQTILTRGQITIPIGNLFLSLISFTVPVSIGIVVRIFKPKWAIFGRKLIRPITFTLIIALNILAIFNSMYLFRAMTWQTIVAGMCVAWGGYFFGGTLAFLCRQKKPQIIAISIETAIQNPGITFMVLRLTLEQPAADISAVAPVSQMMVTSFPLLLIYLIIMIRRRILACLNKDSSAQSDETSREPDVEKPLMISGPIINVPTSDEKSPSDDDQPEGPTLTAPRYSEVMRNVKIEDEPHYVNYPITQITATDEIKT